MESAEYQLTLVLRGSEVNHGIAKLRLVACLADYIADYDLRSETPLEIEIVIPGVGEFEIRMKRVNIRKRPKKAEAQGN